MGNTHHELDLAFMQENNAYITDNEQEPHTINITSERLQAGIEIANILMAPLIEELGFKKK